MMLTKRTIQYEYSGCSDMIQFAECRGSTLDLRCGDSSTEIRGAETSSPWAQVRGIHDAVEGYEDDRMDGILFRTMGRADVERL